MIIAEAGVNHNGSIETAKQLIDVAITARADFVKFQTFKAKTLVTQSADKADYQKNLTDKGESQFEMIKKLELDREAHEELIHYCEQKEISFNEIKIDNNTELRNEMIKRSGGLTVPQIFIGEQSVGGCDELFALHASNQLDELLAKA